MSLVLTKIIRSLLGLIDEMYEFMCSEIPEERLKGMEPLYDSMHDIANDIEKLDHIR